MPNTETYLNQPHQQLLDQIEVARSLDEELDDLRDTDIDCDVTDAHQLAIERLDELRESERRSHLDLTKETPPPANPPPQESR